jgi:hypothetical protein
MDRRALSIFALVAACSSNESPATNDTTCPDAPSDATTHPDAIVDATDAVHDIDAITDATTACAPVKTFSFTTPADVTLSCDATKPAVVLDVDVPAQGAALARATLTIRHVASSVTHFWNASLVVGTPVYAYGIGDDVCPGSTRTRANVGYGVLDASSSHVVVHAYEGAAPCTDGALVVAAGSKVDVWVEAPGDACRGRDLVVKSLYGSTGTDPNLYWNWPTSMARVLTTSITTEAPTESLELVGVIEGSPHHDPNTVCGSEVATLVMQPFLDGAATATLTDVVPASGGMGHVVLSADTTTSVAAGAHTVELFGGSNFVDLVTTGGCCGDATIAAIRRR